MNWPDKGRYFEGRKLRGKGREDGGRTYEGDCKEIMSTFGIT
jgi:hypothetical protein